MHASGETQESWTPFASTRSGRAPGIQGRCRRGRTTWQRTVGFPWLRLALVGFFGASTLAFIGFSRTPRLAFLGFVAGDARVRGPSRNSGPSAAGVQQTSTSAAAAPARRSRGPRRQLCTSTRKFREFVSIRQHATHGFGASHAKGADRRRFPAAGCKQMSTGAPCAQRGCASLESD